MPTGRTCGRGWMLGLVVGACACGSKGGTAESSTAASCPTDAGCDDGKARDASTCAEPRDDGRYCENPSGTYPGIVFADRDHDGHGDCTRPLSACETSAGFVETPDDCDDEDGDRPSPEQWYDGVDSDCDGREDPHGCNATAHPDAIETRSTSEGIDLAIAEYSACDCCEGCSVSIRIANVGATALEGATRVALFASEDAYEDFRAGNPDEAGTVFEFEGPLPSGRVTPPVSRQVALGRDAMRHGYFLVVDPEDAVAESDETNNSVAADGSDIAVCL